jgi:hypothetical protein
MERFGDAMTGGVGPTRSSSSTGMTKLIERRTVGRTVVSKGALLFFSAQRGVFTCEVRDVTNVGAGIRLNQIASAYCRRILNCRSIIFVAFANVG